MRQVALGRIELLAQLLAVVEFAGHVGGRGLPRGHAVAIGLLDALADLVGGSHRTHLVSCCIHLGWPHRNERGHPRGPLDEGANTRRATLANTDPDGPDREIDTINSICTKVWPAAIRGSWLLLPRGGLGGGAG